MKGTLTLITCSLLILLFSYTAVSKLIDLDGFAYDMHNQPFPRWFSSTLVYLLPVMELLIAGLLFSNRTRAMGLWVAGMLMTFFTVYTCLVLLKVFYKVPCSCGGVIKRLNWQQHLFFNLFFVALIFLTIRFNRSKNIHA
ncbi:MAG: MauE/DoxX family redox-associated membrane protein [Bacteroidota bacterium]